MSLSQNKDQNENFPCPGSTDQISWTGIVQRLLPQGCVDPGNKISGEWDWRKVIFSFEEEMSTNILIGNVAVNLFPIYRSIPILFISSLWLIFQENHVKIGFRTTGNTAPRQREQNRSHCADLYEVLQLSVSDGLSCALTLVSME